MKVFGPDKEAFTEADISSSAKRDEMRSKVLKNDLGEIVVVVNHPTKKHFRVLGSAFGEKPAGVEKDGSHDVCVEYIKRHFEEYDRSFRIVSWVLTCKTNIYRETGRPGPSRGEKRTVEIQTIAQPSPDVSYQWYQGAAARARFKDQFYIEPDLCGRPQNSFQPNGTNVGIVVEVIRTHCPEPGSFARLLTLSKTANLIIFYFIPEDSNECQFNRAWIKNGVFELTVSFYILNGKFYESGVHIPPSGRSAEHLYAQYVKGVLNDAKNNVKYVTKR